LLKIDRPEHLGYRVAHHTYGTSGINDQYLAHASCVNS
jgi:hypothetical protein